MRVDAADPYRQPIQLNGQRIHSRIAAVVDIPFKSVPINNPVHPQCNYLERTAERYISDLCKSGHLTHPANGQYHKTK
jgi:hypothetical protein